MADDVEQIAKRIYQQFPTVLNLDGGGQRPVDWDSLVRNRHNFAEEYMKAARNIMEAKRLQDEEQASENTTPP